MTKLSKTKWILLDRDGVINQDSPNYIRTPEQWQPISGSLEAITKLTLANISIAVITNQSGVGRGLYSIDELNKINKKMIKQVSLLGGKINDIFFCPHTPEKNCLCRKPEPGLIHQFAKKYQIDLKSENLFFVGDALRDLQAAVAAHCCPILVKTGNGQKTSQLEHPVLHNTPVFSHLADFVNHLLDEKHDET